jgi:hypothetical protein
MIRHSSSANRQLYARTFVFSTCQCELSNLVAGDFHDPTSYKNLAPRITTDSTAVSGNAVSNFTPISALIALDCSASVLSSSPSSSSSSAASSSPSASEPWLHASLADDSRTFGNDDLIATLDSFDAYAQLLDLLDALLTWEQNGADPAFNGGAAQKASAPLITEQCAKDMANSVARFSAVVRAQAAAMFDANTNMVHFFARICHSGFCEFHRYTCLISCANDLILILCF